MLGRTERVEAEWQYLSAKTMNAQSIAPWLREIRQNQPKVTLAQARGQARRVMNTAMQQRKIRSNQKPVTSEEARAQYKRVQAGSKM